MNTFIAECQRRRVFRVAALYVVGAWIVLQVADLALDNWGIPSAAMRFVWIGSIVGFPIALFLGWRFDVVHGRIFRTPDSDGGAELPLQRNDHVILSFVGVVALAITAGLLLEISRTSPPQTARSQLEEINPRSIAVLPFEDMSASQDQEYFGHGIAEELLNRLAKVKDFRVAGRTSSFSFKDQPDDLRSIGEKLDVAVVLEGSIRKAGKQIRITAQLINAADGFHLWSETYDREMDNVFAVQDEIAGSVVNAILATLDGEALPVDLKPTAVAKSDAYVLYLQGRHQAYKRTAEGTARPQQLFEEAVGIDPDYGPGYAGLATALVLGPLDYSVMFPQAEAALKRALELEPENSEALATLGLLRQLQNRPDDARQALNQAIAINPNNAQAHTWLGRSFSYSSPDRYLSHVQNAYRIDPLDPTTLFHLAVASRKTGRYEEAIALDRELHALDPSRAGGAAWAGSIHQQAGHLDAALKSYFHAFRAPPHDQAFNGVLWILTELGELELAEAWLKRSKERNIFVPNIEAQLLFMRGQPEQAFRTFTEIGGRNNLEMAWAHLRYSGDFAAARNLYERGFANMGLDPKKMDPIQWLSYLEYAVALQRTGAGEQATGLADEVLVLVEEQLANGVIEGPASFPLRYFQAAALAMNGNSRKAIAALRLASTRGELSCTYCLQINPHFDSLRADPDFAAFVAEQEAKLAIIRQRLADEGMLLTPDEVLQLDDFSFDPFLIE